MILLYIAYVFFTPTITFLFLLKEKCNSFIEYYKKMPSEQRGVFLSELAKSYGIDKNSVVSVANSVLSVKVSYFIHL